MSTPAAEANPAGSLSPEREQQIRELAARAEGDSLFVSDCEGELQVWRERALTHVRRDESGEIEMYTFPSSYRTTDQVIEIDLGTWDTGEDAADDQRRQDINDLVDARAAMPALLGEIDRLRNELAEEKASRNPRLRCLIVKAAPDRDLYVGWSNTCEMPAGAWTRTEALAYGFPPSRLDRADKNGSSDLSCGDGHWDDWGFIAEQRGTLRRDRLGDYALLWLGDRQGEAFDLLEPFEGETEVRR
jgi:hypothetical protein